MEISLYTLCNYLYALNINPFESKQNQLQTYKITKYLHNSYNNNFNMFNILIIIKIFFFY